MGDADLCEGGFAKLDSYDREERPMCMESAPLSNHVVIWKKRNRRAFEGVEQAFFNLQSSFLSLVSFWCTFEVPLCIIEDWTSFVENHIMV